MASLHNHIHQPPRRFRLESYRAVYGISSQVHIFLDLFSPIFKLNSEQYSNSNNTTNTITDLSETMLDQMEIEHGAVI